MPDPDSSSRCFALANLAAALQKYARFSIVKPLATADWTVIAAYLAGILAFGLWSGRGQKSTRDYFLGREVIPWWGVGLSIVATETSALTFISVPAMAYGGDLTLMQMILGYVIARILLAIYLVPHYFKGEIFSAYQLLEHAFGPQSRRMAAGIFLVACTLGAGVRVYVSCIPIQLMLGVDVLTAILIFVGLTLVYTTLGGIRSVVWTDAAQFLLFMAGGIYTLLYVPSLVDGGWTAAMQKAAAAGKLHWFNPEFSLAAPFNIFMGLIGGTVLVLFSHGADQMIVQQVLTCGSVRAGRRALILSAVIILPLFLIFLLTGVLLWVYDGQFNLHELVPKNTAGLKQNDYIYPLFILRVVPPWFKGFLIVAILSAAMSSVASALAALSSVSTMDIVKGLSRRPRNDAFYFRFSKGSMVFWCAVLVAVAFASRQAPFVYNLAFTLTGLTSGAMLGGVLLAVFWRGGGALPVMAGMAASVLVMIGLSQISWTVEVAGTPETRKIFWPWFTLFGTTVTVAVAWLVARFSKVHASAASPAR